MSDQVVLLTGASGLLGHWLRRTRPAGVRVVAAIHRRDLDDVETIRVDLRDRAQVHAAVAAIQPDLVLHAAYEKDHASIVSATANVADAAADSGSYVLLTSTDAVFDGDGRARSEHAIPEASWDYGSWKAQAEQSVLDASPLNLVARLPLLVSFAPEDPGTAKIRIGNERNEATPWFVDERRQPAYASEVAGGLWRLVTLDPSARAGIWHLTGAESLSRYELATRCAARLGIPSDALTPTHQPPNSDRPLNIVLSSTRAQTHINWNPTPIR